MKSWFPLTDYDFYAYLASGGFLLATVDYVLFGSQFVTTHQWTIVQGVLVVALAYILGHIIASFSSLVLESWVARPLLGPAATFYFGARPSNLAEKLLAPLSFSKSRRAFGGVERQVAEKVLRVALQVPVDQQVPLFVFEKAAKRGLRYFALARGFSSSQADELFGNIGFHDTKDAWPVFEKNHTTLADATGQGWQYVPPAVRDRNKLVHGARVFDLEVCRDTALKVFDATKALRNWAQASHSIDVWATLPRRLTPALSWDSSLKNK